MPNSEVKAPHASEGVKLVGSPEAIIHLLIPDTDPAKWVADEIENKGPKHKQVLSALLLQRLYKLVQTVQKSSGTDFSLQKGYELKTEKDGSAIILPIEIPINLSGDADKKKIVDAITHAPEHEALVYAIALQVIEWTIKATNKKAE
jgi:hypothetical protein